MLSCNWNVEDENEDFFCAPFFITVVITFLTFAPLLYPTHLCQC